MRSEDCDATFTAINNPYIRLINTYIERTTVYPKSRWGILLFLITIFAFRVYYCQGFLSPQIDPEEDGMVLPVHDAQEFRPFERRLPEFKFWLSATKATIFSIITTFFDIFDLPVFWPILLIYFIFLFILTMRQQIQHMIKYRYVPFSWGKQTYGDITKGKQSASKKTRLGGIGLTLMSDK
ncbi:putative integral membrane protein [Cryptosporidium canis]|uniref:Protein RER1 n=1 Tax=Cryptosporidium canis TaxID=195482 RepID=A0ABQ8PBG9_9CRYT|nr:putative integral membrane protein [Cryptosporidium canis]KAJ1615296.1 putative integral membrane protein [Cryptosporidium canis]